MALSTTHINSVLRGNDFTKRYFLGTYPSCLIKTLPNRKCAFVTNEERHDQNGSHWNAWWVNNDSVIFFDSFGRNPMDISFPHEYRDVLLNFKTIKYVNRQVQSFDSFTCGHFCIHFILIMSLGLNIDSFLSEYTNNTSKNDVTVLKIIESII